ncbi:MAG: hypothetical protein KC800_03630 [Candidatus Eremiobacteraeota bacterium]|nr:hypothetical protein [Candidatus Eremiobacteraeota bacterium]
MKDLVFLLITLGFIMLAMMFAQDRYYSLESETTRQWEKERHLQAPVSPSPSASPTAEGS